MGLNKAYLPQARGLRHCCREVPAGMVCMKKTSTSASQSRILSFVREPKPQVSQHPGNPCVSAALDKCAKRCWRHVPCSWESSPHVSSFILPEIKQSQCQQTYCCPFKPPLCQAVFRQAMTRTGMGREPSSCRH